MYPGGLPPQPPRKNNQGKVLLIVLGVAVVFGLAMGGIVWFNASNAPRNTTVSVGTSSTRTPAPTTSGHSSPTGSTGSPGTGSGGSGTTASSPQALANSFVAAVNSHDLNSALALVCSTDRDGYAKAAQGPNSIFNPAAAVTMTLKGVQQTDSSHAGATVHTEGTLNGAAKSQDSNVPLVMRDGGWTVCGQ
jgi:hypothetical protein